MSDRFLAFLFFLALGVCLSRVAEYARDFYIATGSTAWRVLHTAAFVSLGVVGFVWGYCFAGIMR
jgi:hypothetical protein